MFYKHLLFKVACTQVLVHIQSASCPGNGWGKTLSNSLSHESNTCLVARNDTSVTTYKGRYDTDYRCSVSTVVLPWTL